MGEQQTVQRGFELDEQMAERRPKNARGFVRIPKWIIVHPDLGRLDRDVYMTLAYHADNVTGKCYPGIATIASMVKSNRRLVTNSLHRLAQVGAIVVESDDGHAHRYTLPDLAAPPDRENGNANRHSGRF